MPWERFSVSAKPGDYPKNPRRYAPSTCKKVAEEFQCNLCSLEDPDLSDESRLQVELIAGKVGKGISNIAFTVKGTATTKVKTHADGVLSEGELRAVSLSAFLADVVSSEDSSAIIFDDPMNSLDQGFQERVAKRLVKEARNRQVIVFTHSTAFMGALWYEGIKKDINAQVEDGITSPQPVETHFIEIDKHPGLGTGIQVAESKEPIKGYLGTTAMADKLIGQAKQHHENGDMTAYSRDCMEFGNTIRKAWEYAVEEVVINGVVARNKPGVSTMNLKALLALVERILLQSTREWKSATCSSIPPVRGGREACRNPANSGLG